MTFSTHYNPDDITQLVQKSLASSESDILRCLRQGHWTSKDLPTLLSPAAKPHLETIATLAHHLTIQRFGKTMQLFIPLYLSNVCYNSCTYCSFSMEHDYPRITLTPEEILKEASILKAKGFDHLLLLTGEAEKSSVDYIIDAIALLHPHFSSIGIEVQPLEEVDYKRAIAAGADSLTMYQETYHPDAYKRYHKKGKKSNFPYRLDTPDRAGKAGFYKMNLGALMGLYDWRFDALALAGHLSYLTATYWQCKYAVSFPRIRDIIGDFVPEVCVQDSDLVQLICAFRLIFPDLNITLSTREPASLRDALIPLGITTMSAESSTAPGGYSGKENTESQFAISDHRRLEEVSAALMLKGYEPVFKDWDKVFIA